MNELIDSYLSTLDKKMFWMSRKVRNDIVKEIRSHLYERVESGESPADVITSFGPADSVAKEYLRIYGFGPGFVLVFSTLTLILSIFTVPGVVSISPDYFGMDWVALVFLVLTILFVLFIAYKGGRKAGIISGAVACITRFIVLGVLVSAGMVIAQDEAVGMIGFAVISLMLPMIGYFSSMKSPGKEAEM